jgi:hypothetical protein
MAPNRKACANQPPPPQASDYETDAPPAIEVPRPPPRSNEELNLKVLCRMYPDLVTIEHVTPYTVLYTYKLETQQWEKLGIEGTLFICQLTPSPIGADRYCVIIYNRRGLDSFYQELTNNEEMEVSDPYVIMHGEDVFGIWIFADPPPASTANCRVETAAKLMEYANRARASREALQPTPRPANDVEDASASSAPMGRQLSLRELFGQQREQDAGFSIHSHNSQPAQVPAQPDVLGQLFMRAKQNHNGRG